MQKAHTSSIFVGYLFVLVACVGIVWPVPSGAQTVEVKLDSGETIWLDRDVVNTCAGEGLNLGACACVVQIMLEEEKRNSMTLAEMTRLANAYPAEYRAARAKCITIN